MDFVLCLMHSACFVRTFFSDSEHVRVIKEPLVERKLGIMVKLVYIG